MRKPSRLGLRGRVALLIALAMAPAVCLSLYTGLEQRRLAGVEARLDASRLVHLITSSQDGLLIATHQFLAVLAHVPQVHDGDREACTRFLTSVQAEYPLFQNLGRIDPNGDVTSSVLPIKGVVNLADRSWFRDAVQSREFATGAYQIGRITGRPSINFGHPILDATGRVKGVVFAALDLAWLERVTARAHLSQGATVTVTDRKGIILARYPHGDQWVGRPAPELRSVAPAADGGEPGDVRATGSDGVSRLYAFAALGDPNSGVRLSVGIPEDEAFAQVDRLLLRNLVILCVAGLLAVGVAFFGADLLILRSLRLLIEATLRLADGDLSVRTGLTGARWELGQLAGSFDQMAEALQERARARDEAEARLRLSEARLQGLQKLNELSEGPLRQITEFALETGVSLTGSAVGYLAFTSEEETVLTMHAWSKEAMRECTIVEHPLVYPVEETGLWGEAVRQRKPVITNDYQGPAPGKKGCPDQHIRLTRHMNVPVFDGDRIVAVAGVANKVAPYDESDVLQLRLLMDGMWRLLQRKQSAEALRESENKFRFLFDTMAQGVVVQDAEGRIIEANEAASDILGLPMDELLGTSPPDPRWKLIHEDGSPLGAEEMPSSIALRTGQPVSGVTIGIHLPENDTYRWILASAVPRFRAGADQPYVTMTTFTDVTERKHIEDALSRLSTLLDQTQSLAGVGGWEIDVQRNTLYWTSQTYRTHDLTPAEYTPTLESALAFYTPESRPIITAAVQNAVEHGIDFDVELDLVSAKGRPFTSHLISKAIAENGKTVRIVGAGVDVTERRRAEQALKDSEERFRTVFDSANDAIVLIDGERFVDCNARAVEMFGFASKAELLTHGPGDVSPAMQPDGRDTRETVRAYHDLVFGGTPQVVRPWRLLRRDGTPFDVEVSLNALRLRDKTYIQSVVRDITEQQRAEDALRDSEERFRSVFDTANDAIMILDGPSLVDCNARAVEMFGCTDKADVIDHSPGDFSPAKQPDGQDSRAAVIARNEAALAGIPQRFYWAHVRKDGTPFDAEVSLNALELKGKTYIQAITRDVTEQKRAEEALRDSEEQFRTVFESAYDAILLMDGDTFIDCNAQAVEMYGCDDKHDLIAHTPLDFSPATQAAGQDSRPAALAHINAALAGTAQRFYWSHMRKDGTPFDAEVSLNALGLKGKTYIQAIVRDITERKRAEEALLASEHRFRSVVESSQTAMTFFVLQPDGRLLFTGSNPMADKVLGIANQPRWGMTVEEAFPGIVGTILPETYRKVAGGEIGPQFLEIPYEDEQVGGFFAETVFSIGTGAIVIDFVDITERKRAEEALLQSEAKFRSVVESSPTAMHFWTLRPDGELVFTGANPVADRVLGIVHEALRGKAIEEAFPGLIGTGIPDMYRQVASGEIASQTFETPYGDERFRGYYLVTVFSIAPGAIAADFFDITERKEAEEALRQAHDELEVRVKQRTAELTRSNAELQQFAYVASHDLQEPLRKIRAFGDRLEINAGQTLDERNRDYLQRMLNAAGRMSGLIEALLTYSRVTTKGQPFAPVNLSEVASEVLSDLEVAIEDAGAVVEVGELPTIEADPSQMRQLLQNLIGNALKFRREGVAPRVQVEAEIVPAPEDDGVPRVTQMVRLYVKDNGIGFEEKFAERIFEVFERLHGRDAYGGSGIGLAVCRKIAQRHHGTITASSRPGEGSVFTVTLPVQQPQEGSTT